jgi:protein-tyrosine phosphatase
MRVLMICLGNICRSPLAEGILKHKLQESGKDWYVDSAGIGGWHAGELPDRRSTAIAKKNGIDITDQRARKFQPSDLDNFDLILAMDENNYEDLIRFAINEKQRKKIDLIMNFSRPNRNDIVPDPYYDNRFELVFTLLDEACDAIVKKYKHI